nr:hypothetical protein [uncultured Roseovarius sp.]
MESIMQSHQACGDFPQQMEISQDDRRSSIAGILLVGVLFAFMFALASFLLGAGFWMMLAAYAVGGSVATVLTALIHASSLRKTEQPHLSGSN